MPDNNLRAKTKAGLYWKFAEKFTLYGVNFIIGIVMARLLSPSDFGISALPAVFLAISSIFIYAGFSDALVRKKELKEEDLSTAFLYSLSVGIVCYTIMFFASPWIANFYNTPVLKSLLRVSCLYFIYGSFGIPQRVLLKRKLDFKFLAKISVISRLISGIIGIAFAYFGYGVWSLIIAAIAADILNLFLLTYYVRWYPKARWSKDSFNYLWGYGNKMIASSLIDAIYRNITPIIVGKYFSTADLGIYNRARGYASLPTHSIYDVVKEVSFPVLSKMQDNTDRLIMNYRKMIKVSAFIIFPISMLMSALARPLVITLVTVKWEACIILLQIMCFSSMWHPVHALNLNILLVTGRTDLFFRLEVAKKIVGLTILCSSLPFGLVAFCSAGIVSSIIMLFINTWYTGKFYHFGFKEQLKDLLPTITLSFLVFLSVISFIQFINNLLLQIFLGGTLGFILYIGMAYLFKFNELNEIKYLIKK